MLFIRKTSEEASGLDPDGQAGLDLYDRDMLEPKFSKEAAGDLFSPLGEMYPCFYVTGNHEFNYKNYLGAKAYVRSFGICVLEGESRIVTLRSRTRVCIAGVDDPVNPRESWMAQLSRAALKTDPSVFSILLSHRPERAQTYAMFPFDLVLTGHAHGGQWRIPGLVNGIYAHPRDFSRNMREAGMKLMARPTLTAEAWLIMSLCPGFLIRWNLA